MRAFNKFHRKENKLKQTINVINERMIKREAYDRKTVFKSWLMLFSYNLILKPW